MHRRAALAFTLLTGACTEAANDSAPRLDDAGAGAPSDSPAEASVTPPPGESAPAPALPSVPPAEPNPADSKADAGREAVVPAPVGDGGSVEGEPEDAGALRLPVGNAPFDYQLGGAYEPPDGVEVVSRDRNAPPAEGLYNICYVNGFQTQPDEEDFWDQEHPDLLLRDEAGEPVLDEDWGELLFDTSTEEKRDALAEIVGEWIEGCAVAGFDAVEIDNLDSYSRSEGLLSQSDNVEYMGQLGRIAHAVGLAVGQKNSTELLEHSREMATDFAVAEECNRWDECGAYRDVYGDRVFVIEYRREDFERGCADFPELSIVLRDLDVSPASSGSYVFDGC